MTRDNRRVPASVLKPRRYRDTARTHSRSRKAASVALGAVRRVTVVSGTAVYGSHGAEDAQPFTFVMHADPAQLYDELSFGGFKA